MKALRGFVILSAVFMAHALEGEYRIPFAKNSMQVPHICEPIINRMVETQLKNSSRTLLILTGEQQANETPRTGIRRAQEVANICLAKGVDRTMIKVIESPTNNVRVVRGCLLRPEA